MLGVGLAGPIGTREMVAELDPVVQDGPGAWPTAAPEARQPISAADRDALTVLVSVSGLGPLTLGRLLDYFGSPSEVLMVAALPRGAAALIAASRDPLGGWPAMAGDVASAVVESLARRDEIVALVRRLGLTLVAFEDPD